MAECGLRVEEVPVVMSSVHPPFPILVTAARQAASPGRYRLQGVVRHTQPEKDILIRSVMTQCVSPTGSKAYVVYPLVNRDTVSHAGGGVVPLFFSMQADAAATSKGEGGARLRRNIHGQGGGGGQNGRTSSVSARRTKVAIPQVVVVLTMVLPAVVSLRASNACSGAGSRANAK